MEKCKLSDKHAAMLAHYRAQRMAGTKCARFCTEAKFDESAEWCETLVNEEENNICAH